MISNISVILALAVAMLAGMLMTKLMKLIGLPNVTGYLIIGVLLGPYFWKIFGVEGLVFSLSDIEGEKFKFISDIALGFIAFSIGGEFKLSHLKTLGKSAVVICLFQALSAVILVDIVLIAFHSLLGIDIAIAITLGAIATATAPAATLMVVRQYKAKGKVTDTLLPVVALDDAIGLIVFAISVAIAQSLHSGAAITVMEILVMPLLEIICSLVFGFVIGALMSLGVKFFKSEDSRIILIVLTVLLSVELCKYFGQWTKIGNFAGIELSSLLLCMSVSLALVNLSKEADKMLEMTESWTPPLLMLFFIVSGAELNLQVLPTVGWLGVLYIVARSLGKYFGVFFGAGVVKAEKNVKKYLGFTLLPQAGVAIGMATICLEKFSDGDMGSRIMAVVLCATLIYELVGPFITKLALQKAGEIPIRPRKQKAMAVENQDITSQNSYDGNKEEDNNTIEDQK